MNIKDIEKNYERMSDDELVRIATRNARGLRPEVFGIIENEIKKRNLSPDLLQGVTAQNKEYSIEEIETYSELLRNVPCPACGKSTERLNGTILYTVKSFVILTTSQKEIFVACPDCLNKQNNKAMLSTALLGFWGIPWGLFKSLVYIYRNYKAKQANRQDTSSDALLSFTLSNIGAIATYQNNPKQLQEFLKTQQH